MFHEVREEEMMMSDSLPFTPYDSMEYETVQQQEAPKGFVTRDQASDMQQKDLKALKKSGMEVREQIPMQERPNISSPPPSTSVDLGEKVNMFDKQDISNYKNVYDLVYIILAVLIVDVLVIFLVRYSPEMFGQVLNRWYDVFGLNAVIADVLIIVLGFMVSRYVYTEYIRKQYAEGKWNPLKFIGTLVGVQVIHDLLFYFGIINQLPRGQNSMIDTFKDYAAAGPKILAGDAIMIVLSAGIAMLLKKQPDHLVTFLGALTTYALPYILNTKNQYSVK